jgi:hypothetical protein
MHRLPRQQGFGAGKDRTFISHLNVTLYQLSYRPTCFAVFRKAVSVTIFELPI